MLELLSNSRRVFLAGALLFGISALAACSKLGDPVIEPDPKPSATSPVPVLAARGDTAIREGQLLVLRFTATDPRALGVVYTVEAPGALTGAEWNWRPDSAQAGPHPVRVIAHIDGHPEWADTLTFFVLVTDDPQPGPRLDFVRDTTIRENQLLVVWLSATDPRNLGVTYSMTGPAGAILAGDSFSWQPSFAQAGAHDLVFRVADHGAPARRDSLRVRVTVLDVDRPPAFLGRSDTTIGLTRTLHFPVPASDPDGDAVTYSFKGPTGASMNGPVFQWTPSASQVGTHTLRFFATAKGLSDTDTVIVTVTAQNNLPDPNFLPKPLAHWSFDEGSGALARDSGTGARHFILYGAPAWVAGVSGAALRFNGTPAQYGQSMILLPDMSEQTMSAWVYLDGLKYTTILHESDGASAHDNELALESQNGTTRWMYRTKDSDPKGLHYATRGRTPATGRWFFIAGTSKADTARIYVNGVLAGTDTHAQPFNLSGYHGVLQLARKQSYDFGVQGIVDEVKVYNQALTESQILLEWNTHRGNVGQ